MEVEELACVAYSCTVVLYVDEKQIESFGFIHYGHFLHRDLNTRYRLSSKLMDDFQFL